MVTDYIRMDVIFVCVGFYLIFITNGVFSQNAENLERDHEELFPCQTPDGRKGFCVSMFDCPELIRLVYEQGRVGSKFAKQSLCLGCLNNESWVCCKSPSPTVRSSPPPENITATTSKTIENLEKQKSNNKKKLQQSFLFCGEQHSAYRAVSASGEIQIDEYPWVVQIKHSSDEPISMRCVGVIIEKRYILTTSKCGFQAQTALLGQYSTKESISCKKQGDESVCTEPIREVSVEAVAHSNEAQDDQYGLTLLKVDKPIAYTDYVRPICLPYNRTELSTTEDSLTASGWTGDSGNKKESTYSIEPAEKCFDIDEQLKEKIMEENISLMCLTPRSYYSAPYCAFDFGGPLMYVHQYNKWNLDGLVSNGHTNDDAICSSVNVTGIYLTPKLMDFIVSNVN